jgi:hypothetical protein
MLCQCPYIVFLFCLFFVEQVLPIMVAKTMNLHVMPNKNLHVFFLKFWSLDVQNVADTFALIIIIWMKLRHLGMILWVCLKCMKLLVMSWLYNFKLYWKKMAWFTMLLLLWKMNTSTLKLWSENCDLLLIVNLWTFLCLWRYLLWACVILKAC